MEVWKDIVDFPNYQVSNLGNVKNIKTNKILKWMENPKNEGRYICYEVILYNLTRKVGFHKKVHRLVAEAFLTNPENKSDIDHIDGNTSNNNLTNLRFATRTENRNNKNNKAKYTNPTNSINISLTENNKYRLSILRKHICICDTLEEAQNKRELYLKGELEANVKKKSDYGKYIRKREGRSYEVDINNKIYGKRYYATFLTLEEAIKARDDYIKIIQS